MPGPRLFFADERGLGGRQMLQQQHIHMQKNLMSAKPSMHTGKSRKEVTIEKMICKGTQRIAYLRSVPYNKKVQRVVDYRRYMGKNIDNDPPQNFNALWWLPINQGLREKLKMRKKRKAKPQTFELTDEYGVVPHAHTVGGGVAESMRWGDTRREELSELYAAVRQRREQRIHAGVAYVDQEELSRTARLNVDLRSSALEVLNRLNKTPCPPHPPAAGAGSPSMAAPQRPSTAPPSRGRPVPLGREHAVATPTSPLIPHAPPEPLEGDTAEPSPRSAAPTPAKELSKDADVPTPATPDLSALCSSPLKEQPPPPKDDVDE